MFNPFDYVYIDEFFKKNFKLIKKVRVKLFSLMNLKKHIFEKTII